MTSCATQGLLWQVITVWIYATALTWAPFSFHLPLYDLLKYLNYAIRNGCLVMLNNSAMTKSKLIALLLLLLQQSNDLELGGKALWWRLLSSYIVLGFKCSWLVLHQTECVRFSSCSVFDLWDATEVRNRPQTIAWPANVEPQAGGHQIRTLWARAHLVCNAAGRHVTEIPALLLLSCFSFRYNGNNFQQL